ncbi:MAG: endolytic transglycosylase MltG [Acidobacteriota bacterium]
MKNRSRLGLRWLALALGLTVAAAAVLLVPRFVEGLARRPYTGRSPVIVVMIDPGMSPPPIFRRLQSNGVIESARFLELYYRWKGETSLKAGEYEFRMPATPVEVLRKLQAGEVVLHQVTIPEGLTAAEIAARLDEGGVCPASDYLAAARDTSLIGAHDGEARDLEGYLFPETYAFRHGVGAAEIVRVQVDTFLRRYGELRGRSAPSLGFRDAVILASMIERETGQDGERPLVASVFVNRLSRRMLLQCDPTVIYAMMIEGVYDGTIHRSDLAMASPYNTYLYPGLPPGPICNPGAAALEAALFPPKTDYLYFVSRNDGTHVFSANLSAHTNAVNRYQR